MKIVRTEAGGNDFGWMEGWTHRGEIIMKSFKCQPEDVGFYREVLIR